MRHGSLSGRYRGHSGKHIRSAGRPARSRGCKSLAYGGRQHIRARHRERPGDPAWSETLACADVPCAGIGRSRSVSIGTVPDVDGLPTAAALVPEPKKISDAVVPETGRMDDAWC